MMQDQSKPAKRKPTPKKTSKTTFVVEDDEDGEDGEDGVDSAADSHHVSPEASSSRR